MNSDTQAQKSGLRAKIRAAIKELQPEKRKLDSEKLCSNLKAQPSFQSSSSILFFASLPEEPDLWPLINETLAGNKMVALPCFDADNQIYQPRRVTDIHVELLSGKFGIREPGESCIVIPLHDLDIVLIPGVAFALDGHRLGRGKGFYDRMLRNFKGKKIGIAFDEQITESIPTEGNDVQMDWIVTPTRNINCSTKTDQGLS